MNPRVARNLLSAYLDGELSGEQMLQMREVLHRDASLARELQELREMKSMMSALRPADPPADLEARLLQRVFAEDKPRSPFWQSFSLAAASAVAVGLLTLLYLQSIDAESPIETPNTPSTAQFEIERDQAYLMGSDPLHMGAPVVPAEYER